MKTKQQKFFKAKPLKPKPIRMPKDAMNLVKTGVGVGIGLVALGAGLKAFKSITE